jgi:hypothetical protein
MAWVKHYTSGTHLLFGLQDYAGSQVLAGLHPADGSHIHILYAVLQISFGSQ